LRIDNATLILKTKKASAADRANVLSEDVTVEDCANLEKLCVYGENYNVLRIT
jgi:hypothetical protein